MLFFSLVPAPPALAQDKAANPAATKPPERQLVLKTIGNGRMLGRRAAFRIYEAPDGTQTWVWYGRFASDEQAKNAIEEWVKPYKLIRRDQARDPSGEIIGERIIVSAGKEGDDAEYRIVRRDILNYWLIDSKSLADVTQLDASIDASSLAGR